MKFLIKKIYIIAFFLCTLLASIGSFATETKIKYSKENVSNYFSGIISLNQNYYNKAFKNLKKIKSLKDRHSRFNVEFIRTLVLLEKFEEAITFSQKVWTEDQDLFEADLLLGLNYLENKDYINAEKHFKRLNTLSEYNLFFDNFIGNMLIAWSKAYQNNELDSFKFLEKIPRPYIHLKSIQKVFLQCYYDDPYTEEAFEVLIDEKNYNFSRYNFFLINYLLFNNKINEAKIIIKEARKEYNSNILIKETESFLLNNENQKIKNLFNCKSPTDSIAEFFYVIANLYASEEDYKLSNFYLKISLILNKKFIPNKALLAENYYNQKKNVLSKNIYESLKSIGPKYNWYASTRIAWILKDLKGKEYSIKNLENEFNLLQNPNFEHYFDLANFYKDNENHKKAIKYYSLALKKIPKDHSLVSKMLDRRGTSYERLGEWESAEEDLLESLKILPDQAHVLNYLAYTWIDKGINIDRGLEMLKKAASLRENDGYIIDSLGWAYYMKKDYIKAEIFLQKAVELMPLDPIINDHYADTLWMLDKSIQARYFWKYVLKLDDTEEKLKNSINKKLIFGINKKL